MRKRMAAYCRVSTDKEEQLSSLENQREFFEQYASKQGDTLVKLYADEGISGKSMSRRDAFLRMLDESETDIFDYVAVKDVSRFARNTSDFLYGIRKLKENGVDVIFISGNQTVIGESEFVLTIFAALAQEESANLSKRVIFGKRQNAKKGRVPNCVYGYDKIDTFTMAVNPSESSIVKLIYKWYIEGEGSRRIAIRLNEMGVPTKRNAKWISKSVKRILQNPIYTGIMINNKTVTKDFLSGSRQDLPEEDWYVHERPELRIISDEDFELVQRKITERQEQYKNDNPGNRYSGRHTFSNLIKCGECGKSFTARVCKQKNPYVRYRCCIHNNNGSTHCANSVTIDERELLCEVKRYLLSVIDDRKSFADRLIQQYQKENRDVDTAQLLKAKDNLLRRRTKFKEMYAEGLIEMPELKKEFALIDDGLKSIGEELESFNAAQGRIDNINAIAANIETIIMSNEFSNDDMRSIIEKIVVHPDKSVEVFMK